MNASMTVAPDSYYLDECRKALAESLDECEERDITDPEDVRFILRRAYPFGVTTDNKRAYKIWRKELLAVEANLDIRQRKHKATIEREATEMESEKVESKSKRDEVVILSAADIAAAEPIDEKSAAEFLRAHCRTIITVDSHGDRLRVTLKDTDEHESAVKYEYQDRVDPDARTDWNELYLRAAKAVWKQWAELQRAKL